MSIIEMYRNGFTFYEIYKNTYLSTENLVSHFINLNEDDYILHEKKLLQRLENYRDMPVGQISELLNIPTSTIKKMLQIR